MGSINHVSLTLQKRDYAEEPGREIPFCHAT